MSQLLVLCYHAVSPTWTAPLSVTPEAFERQISSLVGQQWTPATFTEVVRRPPAKKTLVITFDDASRRSSNTRRRSCVELGATATVFAPTDYISRQAPLAWAGLDHWQGTPDARELTPMSWEDLRELVDLGWEIGSHTRTHPLLPSWTTRC